MARKVRTTFLYVVFSIFFCALFSHNYLHRRPPLVFNLSATVDDDAYHHEDDDYLRRLPPPETPTPPGPPITTTTISSTVISNHAIDENLTHPEIPHQVVAPSSLSTVSLLLPDWEVVVIVSPEDTPSLTHVNDGGDYFCLFPNNDVSPAKPDGILPFPDRATFKCILPERIRRRMPFPNPVLTKNPASPPEWSFPAQVMFRWTYVTYDSLTTEDDVIVFAKGPNHRQGINRDPSELNCVFYQGDDVDNGVRTAVTNSMQEVFRCQRPELTAFPPHPPSSSVGDVTEEPIKVTLETVVDKRVVPTVAYYSPSPRKLAANNGRALLCATTMVYNVAKYLKEWVVYHSKIGVEKFILYDNGSDDNLKNVVEELVKQGYDVNTYFWYWPKTQEAGFSHSAVYAKDSCTWNAYIDVDEFIYSPKWSNSAIPSKSMLHSMLHNQQQNQKPLGQVHMGCHEFGPSNRSDHPAEGVIQGYNCRKRRENRHKSIVLLDAIDSSLVNMIHHFNLKKGYYAKKLSIRDTMVNHYKFQAWSEFKAKFRRRVSAYVADWTQQVNPHSNDRAPGLGFSAVEPRGWPQKFCEVVDNGLKNLTRKWFAPSGYKMAWQR
ncbi:hypothetical protein ACH5RR_027589 [Cinchona calisaya]|uniref:Glycosyltransferase family 92 protein n=1 Tax=Cinchona calisaya TaxID=153742 RepID=A0ABD2Z5W1_9GENT